MCIICMWWIVYVVCVCIFVPLHTYIQHMLAYIAAHILCASMPCSICFLWWCVFCRLCGGDPAGQREADSEVRVHQENSVPGQPGAKSGEELQPRQRRTLLPRNKYLPPGRSRWLFSNILSNEIGVAFWNVDFPLSGLWRAERYKPMFFSFSF